MRALLLLGILLLAEIVAEREFGFRAPGWLNITLVVVCFAVAALETATLLGGEK